MMNTDMSQIQIENACIDLIKDHEELIYVTVNTETKTSKCIGSQIGMDFLNRDLALVDKNTNFLELFQQFVKDHYNVTEVSIETEQKTIIRHDESPHPSSIPMDLIGSNQLDFSQSLIENSVQDNILDSIINNENDLLTPFSQSVNGHSYQDKPLDNTRTNENDLLNPVDGNLYQGKPLVNTTINENDLFAPISQCGDGNPYQGKPLGSSTANENEVQTGCIQTENPAQSQLFDNVSKNEIPIEQLVPDLSEKQGGENLEIATLKQAGANTQEEEQNLETSSKVIVSSSNINNSDVEEQVKASSNTLTGTNLNVLNSDQKVPEKETSSIQTGISAKVTDSKIEEQEKEASNIQVDSSANSPDSKLHVQEKGTSGSQTGKSSDAAVSKMVTRRKAGRPRKDLCTNERVDMVKDKSSEIIKTKGVKTKKELIKEEKETVSNNKTPNSGNPLAAKVSRSGRKVVMPKWRLEDQWEVKDIKTEPHDDGYDSAAKKHSVRDKLFSTTQSSSKVINEDITEPGECMLKNDEKLMPLSDKTETNLIETADRTDAAIMKGGNQVKRENENDRRKAAKRKRESSPKIDGNEKVLKKMEDDDKSGEVEQSDNKNADESENPQTYEKMNEDCEGDEDSFDDEDILDPLFKEESFSENEEMDIKEEYSGDEGDEKFSKKEKQLMNSWKCGICNSKAKKCWLVRRHMKRMHDLTNKDLKPCRVCKKVFVYEDCPHELDESSKNYTCEVCQKVFNTKCHLQIHAETHITEKEFPCSMCNKKFKSDRYVKMHIYNTHNKRNGKALTGNAEPGICDICGKWFRFKCNAVRHREIHFEEKRFDCSICNMKFRHSSSLKRHMISHQGKAEFVCEQCGRSFKMKQTLIQHHRTHVKQPFLKCEYCPREFRTYKGKKYHILKDHAEKAVDFDFKSFVCETCGKQSASQLEYNEHKKNHDENRTHVCSICGCRWETAAQLKAHRKSHNVAPYRYRCKVCNIPFKEASKIRLHMTKESHARTCISMGLDPMKDKISDVTNNDMVEIMEQDFNFPLQSEEELQLEIQTTSNDIEEIQEEIKVIHINPIEYDGTEAAHLKILNEEGIEIMYDEISLPQEEITVDGEQVIYQVEIDGQNAIICDNLTSQAVESILKLHSQT